MVKPVNNYILCKVDNEEDVTDTGLTVVNPKEDKTENIAARGIVVTIPDKCKICKPGDTVWTAKWENHKASIGGVEYLVCKQEHILLVKEG